jgi:flagellar biosynthesis protein FlhA
MAEVSTAQSLWGVTLPKGLVGRYGDIAFAVAILGIIGVLIFPIPSWLIDFLLSISIALSILILMTVLFIDSPLHFNSFPSVLLIVTMLRLALNIATTRMVLSQGHKGTAAAGHVVEAFGYFVMQGSVVIGAIVFAILTIINFVVITKGSGRIAEVAARFSLDAMPGKQMAIDADLSAGLIDEKAAKERRKQLEDENTFFGAMDGANKFVRGDAIAGLLVTFINFIGGILIGVVKEDMSFSKALQTYTILTIGDGLVSQIPAIIVSTSAGLLVTKSGVKGSAEKAIIEQLGNYPRSFGASAGLLGFMALMPGIPATPFLITAFASGAIAYFAKTMRPEDITKKPRELTPDKIDGQEATTDPAKAAEAELSEVLQVDNLRIELGYKLLPLLNYDRGAKLTDQIRGLRRQIAQELGFVMPSVRIKDNVELDGNEYIIMVKEIECGRSTIQPDRLLVINPRGKEIDIIGEDTKEPTFGLNARWIELKLENDAKEKGYTVVEPPVVITTHLTQIVKDNVADLLTYGETQKLIDSLPDEHRKLASDVVPSSVPLATLQKVLQSLLKENVSIRDLPTILEAISEVTAVGRINLQDLIEQIRMRLAKQICRNNTNKEGYIPLILLSNKWEQELSQSIDAATSQMALAPSKLQEFVNEINAELETHAMKGEIPAIITSPKVRPYVRSIIERFKPTITVMSQNEIHPKARIKTVGRV